MNLDLDPARRQLVDALHKAEAASGPAADGWDVLSAVGITELPEFGPGPAPLLGLFDWCLVFEELGTGCRDTGKVRTVRAFLEATSRDPGATGAAGIFRSWVRSGPEARERDLAAHLRGVSGNPDAARQPPGTGGGEVEGHELLVVAAYALGAARRCVELAQRRAGARVIAGRRLLEHQGTSHRLAQCAVDLTLARVAVWRAADGADSGEDAGYRAPAAAAASVSAALNCVHHVVQVHGAAGTSDPVITELFRTVYAVMSLTGSPRALWRSAGELWLAEAGG